MDLEFKKSLHAHCVSLIQDKLQLLRNELKEAREAGNDETKSSAGDKHETGRAMAQLEQENLLKQIGSQEETLGLFLRMETKASADIGLGSLVKTSQGIFYIAGPLGGLTFKNTNVMCISFQSPLAQAMKGFQAGNSIQFNGRQIQIENVI